MAKYMQVAASAVPHISALMTLIPDNKKEEAAIHIARIFNLGIRVAPRPVQGTVRLNAVREACKQLPIEVSLERVALPPRPGYSTGTSYNALRVRAKSGLSLPEVDEPSESDE